MSIVCNKYRLYPTKLQEAALVETFAVCRLVYNSMVHERTALYAQGLKSPTFYTQAPAIARWKKDHAELKTVHSQVLQNVAVRVDLAFQAFFRRVKLGEEPGYPRLKGKGRYDSITYPQSGYKVGESSVWLSLLGKQTQVKAKVHRAVAGTVKTCTVRQTKTGKWFVCFSCEVEPEHLEPSEECVGIDVGLKTFAALSNGEFIDNPRFFRKDEKALAKAQRRFDKVKNKHRTKARKAAKKVVARIHERVRNRRHDFVHQIARRLVNKYGVIAVEALQVENMVRSPKAKPDPENEGQFLPNGASAKAGINKSIADASWSMFRSVLTSKAENAGRDAKGYPLREVYAINPAYTSQDCSGCGYRPDGKEGRTKKKLSDRWHHCPMCSASLDRDTNAAINILNLAIGKNHNKHRSGITERQVIPVEAPPFMAGE